MSDTAQTLPEKLAREIARVTTIRAQTAALVGMRGVNVTPLLCMLDTALERAKRAAGSPDILGQIAAVKDLEGFKG